ncbi:VanW family protein [Brevibacillus dissolubilis]|uniref:VanW family protein n=1 Tax=Brevibacillus dissolubilis TaxID=1844116 RepID=UPI0011165B45|nr:VanW family protein [Brevibacillus dissolubilis]
MDVSWLIGLAMLMQAEQSPASFLIDYNGQRVAAIERSEYTMPLSGDWPVLDIEKLNTLMKQVDKQVTIAPQNARIDENGRILQEKKGRRVDHKKFLEGFYQYYYSNGGSMHMQVPTHPILPRVDRQLLTMLHQKKLGQYITYYNSYNKNRSTNIELSAQAINSYVLFPGEVFSFNKVVGQRTKERGYLPAPVIVKGELSEGVGGGICQVSSTLYNAVDRSGLKIVQRYSHSRDVAYVPPGRDATVSWYGPDFRFQNKYPYPVLIRAYSRFGKVVVTIHSFSDLEHETRDVPSAKENVPEEQQEHVENNSSQIEDEMIWN